MEEFEQQGVISFIIVHYTAMDEMYYVPFADVKKFWDRMEAGGRKSFTYDEIDKNWKIRSHRDMYVHYLEPLSIDLSQKMCIRDRLGKDQYLVPYLMSSHPGSSMKEAVELAEYLRDLGYMPEQVQDFYPTPSTISTCMYYTGYDCRTMEKVYVPINPHEKAMQRALIQYRNPKNYDLVAEALKIAGRTDPVSYTHLRSDEVSEKL